LHHATIVDEHEQRVHRMKMEAKRIAGEQPDHAKGHWAQLRVSAPAPSLRDFAFAVRLARRWMPSIVAFPFDTARYLSAKGVPTVQSV
jgi:hypothetical protein